MKIEQLYQDYGIDYATAGQKNVGEGWIGINCPFCNDTGKHLGYNLDEDYYFCWRCGWHSVEETLIKLLSINEKTVEKIIKQYRRGRIRIQRESKSDKKTSKEFHLPSGCKTLQRMHEQYLQSRGFDPDRLVREWGLLGTGPVSNLGGSEYRFRIMAPIRWNGIPVSFQGRDITDRHPLKYKACPKDHELVHHKDILYARQDAWSDVGIVTEGITDAWRMGVRSCATFGIKFKRSQARIITKSFKRVFILFDPDKWAQWQANMLKIAIEDYPVSPKVEIINLDQDPGSMKQEDADYLLKQLIKL